MSLRAEPPPRSPSRCCPLLSFTINDLIGAGGWEESSDHANGQPTHGTGPIPLGLETTLCGSVVWNLCHGSTNYVSLNLCWSVHTVLCQHDSLNWLGCVDFECTIMTDHECDVMYVGFFSFGLALFSATCSWVFKVLFANALSQVFEHSIEAGFPLLVENMPEHIDAVLQPVTLQGVRWYRMLHIGWDRWYGFSHSEILRGDTEPLKELKHDAAPHEWGRIM